MSMKGILKKVKIRSLRVTIKLKPQTCRATHVFWVILYADMVTVFDPMSSSNLTFDGR